MSKTLTAIPLCPTLVALKPRQVLLSQHNMKYRSDGETIKSSAVLKPPTGSADEAPALQPEQRTLLRQAVALYLERNGFSKTLKKFRSEAQIEKDSSEGCLLNLEEMCYKYLKKCFRANTIQNKQEIVKEVAYDRVPESQEPTHKFKAKKKMKKNVVSGLHVDTVEKEQPESLHVESLKNSKGTEASDGNTVHEEVGKKSKDKKKTNKQKLEISIATSSEDVNVSRDFQAVDSISLNDNDVPLEEKVLKSKTKKKKDAKHLNDENLKQPLIGNGTMNKNDGIETLHEDEYNENSKKRKRLAPVEHDSHPVDEKETEDIKRRKLEGSKRCNDDVQSTKVNASVGADVNAACRSTSNQLDEQSDGNIKKTGEKTLTKKTMRKQSNGSAEPKTVNAFQRVKVDTVVFKDEKLADNSYWAKGGAEIGYGAKAQEILGQVKGRDFRHEKTKKKRGTYRGGVIDLQSHSVKFNYSDDD